MSQRKLKRSVWGSHRLHLACTDHDLHNVIHIVNQWNGYNMLQCVTMCYTAARKNGRFWNFRCANVSGEWDGCCQMRSDVGQNMSKCVAFASQSEQKGSKRHKRQGGRVSECLHIFALAPSGTFSHWCAAATSQGGTMASHEGQQDLAVNRYPISTVKARWTLSAERV